MSRVLCIYRGPVSCKQRASLSLFTKVTRRIAPQDTLTQLILFPSYPSIYCLSYCNPSCCPPALQPLHIQSPLLTNSYYSTPIILLIHCIAIPPAALRLSSHYKYESLMP